MQRDRIALLRHGDKTQKLLGLIFRVRNELKAGWSEDVYHQALLKLCETEGVPVISKPRMVMLHRGTEIHIFEPDLIVWDLIILELKALAYQTQFTGDQYAQLIHYLKYYNKDLGLLINFAPKRVQTKRILWDEPVVNIYEEYERESCHYYLNKIAHHYASSENAFSQLANNMVWAIQKVFIAN